MVTLPFSTKVLTSTPDSAGSEFKAFSMFAWIVASSSGAVDVSPPPIAGDDSGVNFVCGVGDTLGEGFGDGVKLGPTGTTCSGATLAFIGS